MFCQPGFGAWKGIGRLLLLVLFACVPGDSPDGLQDCQDSPLRETARQDGGVRLIVHLAGDFRPETALSADEMMAQRSEISSRQDQILQELQGTDFTLVRRFDVLPIIVLRVDETGFCRLAASEHVDRLEEDKPEPPTGDT